MLRKRLSKMDISLNAVLASLAFCLLYGLIACYDTTWRMIDYVYYPSTLGWNEARNVCHSIGGDLAKIDSTETLEAILGHCLTHMKQTGDYCPLVEFWIGLYYATPSEQRFALDCSSPNGISTNAKYYSNRLCFPVSLDWTTRTYSMSGASCVESLPFLCEIHAGRTCSFSHKVNEWKATSVKCVSDYNACENLCAYDRTCMDVLFVSPSTCYTLPFSTSNVTTQATATRSSKVCGSFVNNATQFTPDPYFQDMNAPMVDCGVIPTFGPPNSSLLNISTACLPPATTTVVTESTFTMEFTEALLTDTVTVMQSYMTTPEVISATVSASIATTSFVTTQPSITSTSSNTVSLEAERIAAEISKNLTVDAKETSSFKRSLICARDVRKSSLAIGTVGMACIAVPLALIMSTDIIRALRFVKNLLSFVLIFS